MPSSYFINRLTEFLINKKDWVGLDIGCGSHLGVLAEYGMDAAPADEWTFSNPEYPRDKFTRADIYDMPYEDNSVDYIVSAHVFEHLEHSQKAISEMARVASKCVISNIPRYTLDLAKVTGCVILDKYYLVNHKELWADLGLTETNVIWQPGATSFWGYEAPHCQWFPDPEDAAQPFIDSGLFRKVDSEVCPHNCGESNVYAWLI
jgi:ubiquinone/menaquinone biosynthesis C-methylase UbiE